MVKSITAYCLLALVVCFLPLAGWTSTAEAAVRDEEIIERLARLETIVEKGFANLQIQIDNLQGQIVAVNNNLQRQIDDGNKNLQRQIDDVRSDVRWRGGILFAGMFVVVGFVLWDRRMALVSSGGKEE
ncbi:MAG: hypothetical protein QME81_19305 [bacterium]|nr:hypothetical protein [bacterium]